MGKFSDNVFFETECCCTCGMMFAMPSDFRSRRRKDHALFYCPAGHCQHYTGKTEEQKLREQLEQEQRQLEHAREARDRVIRERDTIAKAHKKMRVRVANGVCPCCNRSFENLRSHMATQHADFGTEKTLRALREAFGMTQADVAKECGTRASYVSLYENGKPVPAADRESLTWWLDRQAAG